MFAKAPLAASALFALLLSCGPAELLVTMYPENNSGQAGTARLTQNGGKVEVKLALETRTDTGEQAAHIHSGRCGEIGPVVPAFPGSTSGGSLRPVAEGSSITVLEDLALSDLTGGRYAINVHYSKDAALYVACGNIP